MSSMLRGFLRILVLKSLAEGPKSGYALMKFVEDRMGVKPSPGSMYPLLEKLEDDGILTVTEKGRAKEYKLTTKGKRKLTDIEKKRNECLSNFLDGMKMLQALTGEDMQFPMAMVQNMKEGRAPFKEINPGWDNLREQLFKMMQDGTLKQKAPQVRKILQKTYKEIAQL